MSRARAHRLALALFAAATLAATARAGSGATAAERDARLAAWDASEAFESFILSFPDAPETDTLDRALDELPAGSRVRLLRRTLRGAGGATTTTRRDDDDDDDDDARLRARLGVRARRRARVGVALESTARRWHLACFRRSARLASVFSTGPQTDDFARRKPTSAPFLLEASRARVSPQPDARRARAHTQSRWVT